MRDYISKRVQGIPPSGIRKFFDILATMDDVISLGIGEPDFTTPPSLAQAGITSIEAGITGYTSNAGTLELRTAVAAHIERLYGVSYDPTSEVLITVGVSEAMYLAAAALFDPSDEVIIPEPCFVSYVPEVLLTGATPVTVPTYVQHDFQVTGETVAKYITPRTKAIIISYPNNPTGAVMTRERLLEIAALAEEHDLLVITDEIYDRLVYDFEHVCFSALPNMRERTILLNGFSKAYAMTGWRAGYICAPAPLLEAMNKVHQYTIMSAPTAAQYTALAAMKDGEPLVEEMRCEYDRRRRLIVDGLNSLGLPTFEPRGAFYAFPSVQNTGMDEYTFSELLLKEEKVAVVPGSAFGPSGAGFVRCAYATAYEQIEEALERIGNFVARHA